MRQYDYPEYISHCPHVSVPVRLGQEAPLGADLAAPVPVLGEPQAHHNTSASVVFNTNEQKTATIGRVPRVSR